MPGSSGSTGGSSDDCRVCARSPRPSRTGVRSRLPRRRAAPDPRRARGRARRSGGPIRRTRTRSRRARGRAASSAPASPIAARPSAGSRGARDRARRARASRRGSPGTARTARAAARRRRPRPCADRVGSAAASRRASSSRAGSTCATATRSMPSPGGEVDRAPVCDRGDREPGDRAQRLLVVERAREHPARLGQEPVPVLGALEVGDVLDHVDREPHRAVVVEHRRRLDPRPAFLGALAAVVAHGQRRRPLAGQRAPAGEPRERERCSVLVVVVEPADELRR